MITLKKLTHYLDQLLDVRSIPDYCPNGLQIQGRSKIKKIISGVSICQELIDHAIKQKVDAVLVHHGFFWKGEDPCIKDLKYQRISSLLKHDISVLAYHLPLDIHPIYGNNAQLAKVLNFKTLATHDINGVKGLLFQGELPKSMTTKNLAAHIKQKLKRPPQYFAEENTEIKTIAWCTGAAQDLILNAIELGCDTFITGEVSERTFYFAQESEIAFFAAGHHATERYGVQALGTHIQEVFDIDHNYVEIENPV